MRIDKETRDMLRHALDAMSSVMALASELLEASEPEGCEHPPEQVECLTTFGGPEEYRCNQCGETRSTPFHQSA